ncbi:MAG: GNAT family N-acetyltransferase [Planctomyces sp.]|nr:GNAT family N-acetyltransferase [Planctomyces sp.]
MYSIRGFTLSDYEAAIDLWHRSKGVVLSEADSREAIAAYLNRNVGLSLVATKGECIVATLLCGHDGRRGYLHHLAVDEQVRRHGIGRALVERALDLLTREGIEKCYAIVLGTNEEGARFWRELGWEHRTGLEMFSQFSRGR